MSWRTLTNTMVRRYLRRHYERLDHIRQSPGSVQQSWFKYLLERGRTTAFGKEYGFRRIKNYSTWQKQVPVFEYDTIKPYIQRMMEGQPDVLWPGVVSWFAKSSGTTQDQSKYIPVSKENLKRCHIKGAWDSTSILYHNHPAARLFADKSLILGGSLTAYEPYPATKVGDVSAIMLDHMPWIGRPLFTPDFATALYPDWEEKISRTVEVLLRDRRLTMIGGVPTWNIVLIRKLLEHTGAAHMLELFPKLEVYMHGGVGFEPYRPQFQQYLPSKDFIYQEVYNASEGYFAVQDDYSREDLLLLLDNGMFFEFIPREAWGQPAPPALRVDEVELERTYVMLVSTNSGLWRYVVGDLVQITSVQPLRIKIAGRTSQYINAFGEEVMIHNTDLAVARTCEELNAVVTEYTVAPIYLTRSNQGAHQWIIEFEKAPMDLNRFASRLDIHLQSVNSDYKAKRHANLALNPLKIKSVPHGTFLRWMQQRGKMGGQNKVPRLANDRRYVDAILEYINS